MPGQTWVVIVSVLVQYYTGDHQEQRVTSRESFSTYEECMREFPHISERMTANYLRTKRRFDEQYVAPLFQIEDIEKGCRQLVPMS